MLNTLTALPMLGVVNNDKRDTLSFIFQIGLPALEECIKKKKKIKDSTGKGLLLLWQNLALQHFNSRELKCCWNSSFPEGREASFLDLHRSIIASI